MPCFSYYQVVRGCIVGSLLCIISCFLEPTYFIILMDLSKTYVDRGYAPFYPTGQMQFMLLFSRQGKIRLQKWYAAYPEKVKKKIVRELVTAILTRKPKMSSFIEWKDSKIVYKRYASLYFCCCIERTDNELLTLEIIHRYVELLDKYFGNVCELDIIFNFEKAHFVLDEFILGGEVQESSQKTVLAAISQQDIMQEETEEPANIFEELGLYG